LIWVTTRISWGTTVLVDNVAINKHKNARKFLVSAKHQHTYVKTNSKRW